MGRLMLKVESVRARPVTQGVQVWRHLFRANYHSPTVGSKSDMVHNLHTLNDLCQRR